MLVAGSAQRGFTGAGDYGAFPGPEERDLRDVEDTIRNRDHYAIDPNKVIFSGMSMGGSTTKTMSTLYPDELAAAVVHNAPGEPGERPENLRDIPYYQVNGDTGLDAGGIPSGRSGAEDLDARGYRQMYVEYLGRAHDFDLVYDSVPILEGTAYREVRDPDPPRVTYTLDAASEDPKLGLVHDRAYWASALTLPKGAETATLEATALPMAGKLPKLISHLTGHFTRTSTSDVAYVDWQVWDRDLTGRGLQNFDPRWAPGPDVSVTNTKVAPPEHAGQNAFTLTTSYAAQTLDLDRMRVRTTRTITGYVKADPATALTLAADTAWRAAVTIDGKPVAAKRSADGRSLTVTVPAGEHEVRLTPVT
jgi:pimeloyl-ACP methyl ester carboxylesterase